MRRSKRVDKKTCTRSLKGHDVVNELTSAWRGLAQSKTALRQIENKLEAGPGTGVLLEPVLNPTKKKSLRKSQCDELQPGNYHESTSKKRSRCHQSPEKSNSRSPLRNSTLENTVRQSVEFREPVASYREATPPPLPTAPSDRYSPPSVPESSYSSQPSNPSPSHLVSRGDTRDKQTGIDLGSTFSSALENMEVHYLNDQPALETLRTDRSHPSALTREAVCLDSSLKAQFEQNAVSKDSNSDFRRHRESTPSSSPGSASQRLENLRRHQPDDKLEKLKERIRKQRQHLEQAAEKERLGSYTEKPIVGSGNGGDLGTLPTVKIRKVATAPSAPIYKGFNSTETKIQTPDGKIWNEEDFHNLSREIYKDLSRQFAESTKCRPPQRQRDLSKERSSHKPVRKVQKIASSGAAAQPVISPASWREGQKLVKMVLKNPELVTEEYQTEKKKNPKVSHNRSTSDPCSAIQLQTCPQNTVKKHEGSNNYKTSRASQMQIQEKTSLPVNSGISADIRGMLDDLQLESKTEHSDRARSKSRQKRSNRPVRGGSDSTSRARVSGWAPTALTRGCRSGSPSHRSRSVNTGEAGLKKRHYDADSVRQYIAQQQEKRKRQQVEEKKALREETEKRHQRLQDLYKKQRDVAKTAATASVTPAQMRLQETFNKLLLEHAQLEQGSTQMRTMYQPSGESDKENIRLELAQSPSSSDRSLNGPPVSRNGLGYGEVSLAQPETMHPVAQPVTTSTCSNEHFLSQLLRLESALAASEKHTQKPVTAPRHSPAKLSRIEALKATATSLSNRIENEACQLAREGLNFGLTTTLDVDSILLNRSLLPQYDDGMQAEMLENHPNSLEIEDLYGNIPGAQSVYNGSGSHGHNVKAQKGKTNRMNSQIKSNTRPAHLENYFHNKRKSTDVELEYNSEKLKPQVEAQGVEERRADRLSSSSASISEGPLSEGSLTDEERGPPHATNAFIPIGHQGAAQHFARKSKQRLLEFQEDANNYAGLSSLAHQENSNPSWEELNKGSPLSVINIFTKNLHGNTKATDVNVEKISPSANLLSSRNHVASAAYGKDFALPHGGDAGQNNFESSHYEELLRHAPEKRIGGSNPDRTPCSTPGSSPHSKSSTKKGKISDHSDVTLMEDHTRSPSSEVSESRINDFKTNPDHSQASFGDVSGVSHRSSKMDEKSPPSRHRESSKGSLDNSSDLGSNSSNVSLRRGSSEKTPVMNAVHSSLAEIKTPGDVQYSPAVLQQRLAAELHYIESIEESVRQLGDIERLMGVSVAQRENASLTQILKAKQQQHEQELYELKIRTEREALETQLQMEENRQRVARARMELQEGLAATQKETLEGLQEATAKMMSQQAEAARFTADTARHIKEMTEIAHSQLITGKHACAHSKPRKENSHAKNINRTNESYASSRAGTEESQFVANKYSYSDHSDPESLKRSELSELDSSSHLSSTTGHKEKSKPEVKGSYDPLNGKTRREEDSIAIEEDIPTALDESLYSSSIPSALDEKGDITSVATEYSHKFDESITEDEIEERSFRSLLPSEAHRRESLDKKLQQHDESDEDGSSHNSVPAFAEYSIPKPQDVSFSGGQDSFSHFTMEMVRQYMRDEEVRLQHQSALLHLRQKALKEKTRTELAWLEHQKKKLRDKGEDDKMPPIKKKQRGLLLKLQQEQAEIKRLQEANKAARKERQLLLKQQEEIERMRSSTLKLKERLRCAATESPSDTSVSEAVSSNLESPDPNVRSPSPSISGSETSSVMQKLKKMLSHKDEKFLTKREQQLLQRRHHAEELLQWKQRLDQEEAEVRKMERKALAAWDGQTSHKRPDLSGSERDFITGPSPQQTVELNALVATSKSSIHTDVEGQDESPRLAKDTSVSDMASFRSSPANYTEGSTPAPHLTNRQAFRGVAPNSEAEYHQDSINQNAQQKETTGYPASRQTEPISDQSDIESRIKALKEELKKRRFTANQLRKEQKKRTHERLKAKEANLLKQLDTYNDFIEKTKAELDKQTGSAPDTKSQISPSGNRFSSINGEPLDLAENARPNRSGSTSMPSMFSDDDPATVTSTPRNDSPDCLTSRLKPILKDTQDESHGSQPQHIVSELGSEILEEELKSRVCMTGEHESEALPKENENKMGVIPESRSQYFAPEDTHHVDLKHQPTETAVIQTTAADRSYSPDTQTHPNASSNESIKKGTLKQDKSSQGLLADGYRQTFDSTANASLREHDFDLKPAADSNKTTLQQNISAYDSLEEEIEEEIVEDISELSVSRNGGNQFTKVQDAQDEGQACRPDGKGSMSSVHSTSVTPPLADGMQGFKIGDRVVVSGVQPGTLRFKGPTNFANGYWAGVELDKSEGSNNGTYDGVVYFECPEQHGIFAPPDKVTHLTDKFELFTDTTEDDDSFDDDMSENEKRKTKQGKPQKPQHFRTVQICQIMGETVDKKVTDDSDGHLDNALSELQHHKHTIPNGKRIWDSGDLSPSPLIEDIEIFSIKDTGAEVANLVERSDAERNHKLTISSDLKHEDGFKDRLGSFADKFLNNLVKDTVQTFAEMKISKANKIRDASDMDENEFGGVEAVALTVDQKDGLPFFLTQERKESSSPELHDHSESPILGASGQQELAKRLAELELSRELDEFGDDQDWFDEDFGLSSRREQQRLKQRQREADEQANLARTSVSTGTVIAQVPSPGDQQGKTPPRPELPLPMPPKLPEEPAMVVPHSATEVEKMVQAAVSEIWETCGLNKGDAILTQQKKPNPSAQFFGEEPNSEDPEAVCLHSYKKAVFDLTWEILQDVFAEDPNANQPQWVKPQRVKSSFHRVRTPGDIRTIQEFVTAEVLKLYGLAKHQDQQTDWPKILKFGRKKRDRVDNILVQELHEEESQWVNYDEDELFVKMQLADGIFDALLKDTADVLAQICDKRSQKGSFSR